MRISFIPFIAAVLLIAGITGLSSCANIIPPSGGPADTIPPHLVMAQPRDSAVNVSTHQVTLTFDEFVSLENIYSNLIVSPSLKTFPNVTARLRNVNISIRDTLEPNTTYLFDFGNAIKDVNEGNVARNFRYAFSTGSKLDNNTYSGQIILAETGKTDSNLYALLYRNLGDSAVYKETPRYYTRVNGRGEFTFHNLPDAQFAVYVIDNKSALKTYTDSSLLFAFRGSPVTINANTPRDTLYAYQAYVKRDLPSIGASLKAPGSNDKRLRYSPDLENGQQDILDSLSLVFQRKLTVFDSTKIVLADTNYQRQPGYSVWLDTASNRLSVIYPWKQNTAYRLLIAKDAIADSAGYTLAKADTLRFVTKKETDYGSIRIRFSNIDLSRNPVLQLVKNETVITSVPLTTREFYRKFYPPGSYDVRILYDANRNGVWDPGQFLPNRRQPEVVQRLPKQVLIRANWDNDVTF